MNRILACMLAFLPTVLVNAQAILTDVTINAGVSHRATFGDINLPAQGGAAWFDFNNDGWYDLYLTGGTSADALFVNNGNGTFSDYTVAAGIDVLENKTTNGVTTGDVNNDGWQDILITTVKTLPNYLMMNNGDGTFSSTIWAGSTDLANSYSASMGDINKDGWLDIYVCNWSRDMEVTIDGSNVSVDSQANFFYMNNGDGTFSSRAQELEIDDTLGCALGVMFTDFDNDNDLDIYVANDFGFFNGNSPNRMYRNNHPSLSFTEVSEGVGLDEEMNGMGVAKADLNEDGKLDYFTSNIRTDRLMISSPSGYTDEAVDRGIMNDSVWLHNLSARDWNVGWGAGFMDIDNDADEDLFVVNGSLSYDFPHPTLDSNKLFLNDGHGGFTDVSLDVGVADTYVSRAFAYCDYDLDGDLDAFVGITDTAGGTAKSILYRNDSNPQDWLQVKATGVQHNNNGIGARVIIYVGGLTQIREIGGESSFNSQHWMVAHFGLGGSHSVDSLDVVWNSGNTDRLYNLNSNQMVEVLEGEGQVITSVQTLDAGSLKLFPNPFVNTLFLQGENITKVEVLDSNGALVATEVNGKFYKLDLSHLSSGVYTFSIYDDRGNNVIRKVVKR